MKIDKIFVLHHPPLKNRKEYLLKELSKYEMEVEWVEDFGIEEIKDKYDEYTSRKDEFYRGKIITPRRQYKNFSKKISLSELSLYLKHRYCFQQQKQHGYNTILILEDDIVCIKEFSDYIHNHITEFQNEEGDMLIMGKSHNFNIKRKTGKYIHHHPHYKTRCTHAIAYNKKCIDRLLNNIDIINLPIDFKLNEIIQKESLKVYWSAPGILQNNNYKSAIKK